MTEQNLFVTNSSTDKVEVAINIWESGNPGYFTVETGDGHTEGWFRSDARGFIMAVLRNNTTTPELYHVFGDRDYRVKADGVYLDGTKLPRLSNQLECALT